MKATFRFLVGILIVLSFTAALGIGTVHADIPRAKAWVWAGQPTASSYIPSIPYQYNSGGGTNRVIRHGVGVYTVGFPGLAASGGMVQVSAYGGNQHCKVAGWYPSGGTQFVRVRCFDPAGNPADGKFTTLFYKESRRWGWRDAYLWADQPTSASYTPSRAYQWNSQGLTNTVRRLGTGHYQARLPGMDLLGGTALVTAYGSGPEQCKVEGWTLRRNDTFVNVRCFAPNGDPVDTRYTLSFMKDVGLGVQYSEDQHYGGYVWANEPTTASYVPHSLYQLNTAGPDITITRLSMGAYRVHLPWLAPWDRTTAVVTAYGGASEYCTVSYWTGDGSSGITAGTNAHVQCFSDRGDPVDTRFTLLYLTDDQILY